VVAAAVLRSEAAASDADEELEAAA
jgi:hypothetical protein